MKRRKRVLALLAAACLSAALLAGCGGDGGSEETDGAFVLGDTTFNAENEEPDVNPHNAYSGWACIRYGVGETLFRWSDSMEIEPWLATGYERTDEYTWVITLRDGVTFSSGRPLDGQAVQACLTHLVETHDRARGDLMIESIAAEGQTVTITTAEPRPTLLNYLSDPYGCIIDMEAGITAEGVVVGTGPYVVTSLKSGEELDLVKNETYWGGTPGYDRIKVLTITDGDTLTMALQSGQIDAAYGLPYASYPLFENEDYTISSCATSRTFFLHMNFESAVIQDDAVRRAIAMGVDKERFVEDLLDGNGYVAAGPFPDSFSFGGGAVTDRDYDPEVAKALLEQAGWVDTDGDGDYTDAYAYDMYDWYVLTSPLTFSAANFFASIVQDVGIATVVGERSGGGTCSVFTLVLPDGTTANISGSRTVLQSPVYEGGVVVGAELVESGIAPDIALERQYFYNDASLVDAIQKGADQ